ncbi:hypothetical protein MUK42_33311 [Musa troglodytarum]|uniref:Uncharacterized protein n=1 Tax=Musa troglodytarum TaxID=320322 RepID=A0A9E7L9J6_9LILI|nr:hypothetical protein MUK42_33311 [Musa troglodytarum]URE45381.1 hypothetical protein MUK42_33311 [Musa troglodytarum]
MYAPHPGGFDGRAQQRWRSRYVSDGVHLRSMHTTCSLRDRAETGTNRRPVTSHQMGRCGGG